MTRRKKLLVDSVSVNLKSSAEDANLRLFDAHAIAKLEYLQSISGFADPIFQTTNISVRFYEFIQASLVS